MSTDSRIEVWQGDITTLSVDAIVNAANWSLLGGGGVDGAIHRAAGPELVLECMTLHGCKTGEAKITRGYRLPAKHVIHTVGPIWQGGTQNEQEKLASCYRNSLRVAVENGVRSIAFPSVSTGIYGYPVESAAKIAVHEVSLFLATETEIERVVFVCFDSNTFDTYQKALADYFGSLETG